MSAGVGGGEYRQVTIGPKETRRELKLTGSCKQSNMGARNQIQVLCESRTSFEPLNQPLKLTLILNIKL